MEASGVSTMPRTAKRKMYIMTLISEVSGPVKREQWKMKRRGIGKANGGRGESEVKDGAVVGCTRRAP